MRSASERSESPLRDLSDPGVSAPMSHNQDPSSRQRNQDTQEPSKTQQERKGRARSARSRRCLLKGCDARFLPAHPMARCCSGNVSQFFGMLRNSRRAGCRLREGVSVPCGASTGSFRVVTRYIKDVKRQRGCVNSAESLGQRNPASQKGQLVGFFRALGLCAKHHGDACSREGHDAYTVLAIL